jgi:hypothetical protein
MQAAYSPVAVMSTGNWAVPGAPPWSLVLSSTARNLVGLFCGLGVAAIAGGVVLALVAGTVSTSSSHVSGLGSAPVAQPASGSTSGGSPVSRAQALSRTSASYRKLGTALSSYAQTESTCPVGGLACVIKGDKKVMRAFARTAATQRSITMPTAGSKQANLAFIGQLHRGHTIFRSLSEATSAQQYLVRSNAAHIQDYVQRLTRTETKLLSTLE